MKYVIVKRILLTVSVLSFTAYIFAWLFLNYLSLLPLPVRKCIVNEMPVQPILFVLAFISIYATVFWIYKRTPSFSSVFFGGIIAGLTYAFFRILRLVLAKLGEFAGVRPWGLALVGRAVLVSIVVMLLILILRRILATKLST